MSEHLYIHIPFCLKKCGYCDFFSLENLGRLPEFVSALKKEIRIRAAGNPDCVGPVTTLYFGGGTPSVLPLKDLESILDTIGTAFRISPGAEITLEANPGTVSDEYFAGLKQLGVNRLSLGIQSFDSEKLKFLGRVHTSAAGRSAIAQARDAGFDNIGFDLIYGVPGESDLNLRQELAEALAYQPEHLSCYTLTLEPGTPLYAASGTGAFSPMSSSAKADLFSLTSMALEAAGFFHYEISNFARGRERISRHNSAYWQMTPYTGFGPSAHSLFAGRSAKDGNRPVRSWNVSDLDLYIQALEQGRLAVEEQETLNAAQQMAEMIMVGLRTRKGIDVALFDRLSKVPFTDLFHDLVTGLETENLGYLTDCGGYFFLTLKGWNRLDGIVEAFAEQVL